MKGPTSRRDGDCCWFTHPSTCSRLKVFAMGADSAEKCSPPLLGARVRVRRGAQVRHSAVRDCFDDCRGHLRERSARLTPGKNGCSSAKWPRAPLAELCRLKLCSTLRDLLHRDLFTHPAWNSRLSSISSSNCNIAPVEERSGMRFQDCGRVVTWFGRNGSRLSSSYVPTTDAVSGWVLRRDHALLGGRV